MSLLTKKTGSLFPTLRSSLLDTDRFFGPRLFDLESNLAELDLSARVPSVNISEDEKEFKLEMAAPGLSKKDFKIETEDGTLVISAEKEEELKEEKKNYKRKEYSYNSFSRSFTLPENILSDKIDAKYEDGVLRLSIPKKEVTPSKPKKEIKVV